MQVLIIGAGVVGLAVARAAARKGHEVIVAEAESGIGTITSSRNSEVIHAGMYYPTGTLRAHHCVRGRRMLYEFCASHGVPHNKCGKLIVATDEAELEKIKSIEVQGGINGVEGLELIGGNAARALEPELSCIGALLRRKPASSTATAYMLALRGDLEDAGGAIALQHAGDRAPSARTGNGRSTFGGKEGGVFTFDAIANCAGLARAGGRAHDGGLSGSARAAAGAGQGQLFLLRGQAGVQAADLSDADRRRARRARDARYGRPHALWTRRGMGRDARITPSIRRARIYSMTASALIGRACRTTR